MGTKATRCYAGLCKTSSLCHGLHGIRRHLMMGSFDQPICYRRHVDDVRAPCQLKLQSTTIQRLQTAGDQTSDTIPWNHSIFHFAYSVCILAFNVNDLHSTHCSNPTPFKLKEEKRSIVIYLSKAQQPQQLMVTLSYGPAKTNNHQQDELDRYA